MEVSETMYKAALQNNMQAVGQFELYDGESIPYKEDSFDRVFSVNTIYFWSNPEALIHEIERTLKLNGIGVLTYANKSFMNKLEFVADRFVLYDLQKIESLVQNTKLNIIEYKNLSDQVKSETGENFEKNYTMVKFQKIK